MPKKNAIKVYGEGCYYHVYNRGVDKMDIFKEEGDFLYMLGLLKKYLSPRIAQDKHGRELPNYHESLELVAYCLMPNHYHLLVYLKEKDGLQDAMRSIMTAYSMYVNNKYSRTGGLFEGRFLAHLVTSDEYLWHVSRYIHLNPLDIGHGYKDYLFSSYSYFRGERSSSWLHEERLVESQKEREDYSKFLADDVERHMLYDQIKHQLAHS